MNEQNKVEVCGVEYEIPKNVIKMFKPDEDDEQVLFIEYHNGFPFNVITTAGDYQFEECGGKGGNVCCYNSGSGGDIGDDFHVGTLCDPKPPITCAIWKAEGCGLQKYFRKKEIKLKDEKAELLAMGYELLDKPLDLTKYLSDYDKKEGEKTCNPFEISEEIFEGFVYCKICDCWDIESPEHYCRHLFWSPVSSMVMGCGCTETEADSHKESFFKMLDKTKLAKQLAAAIKSGKYETQYRGDIFGYNSMDCYLDGHNYGSRFTNNLSQKRMEAMTDGVGWLNTLVPGKTKEAEKITLKWIGEYLKLKTAKKGKVIC
jgi:hypothetical protein